MTTGPQRHPSRDLPEQTYTNVDPVGGREGGINVKGSGFYGNSEMPHLKNIYDDDPGGFPELEHVIGSPLQGALFDPDKWERAQATKLARTRLQTTTYEGGSIRDTEIAKSAIPTSHLQPRLTSSGGETLESQFTLKSEDTSGYNWHGVGGYYMGPTGRQVKGGDVPDTVAVASGGAVVHELGHRRHLGLASYADEGVSHPRGTFPDPLKEGVADAYEDRYGGSTSGQVRQMSQDIEFGAGKFPSYQYTGYSTDADAAKGRGWNDADRAVYAATRGHASETGEQALYVPRGRDVREQPGVADYGGGDPTLDATLHQLVTTSPHAVQALRQTGLKEQGGQAFRRHRDRQLLTQGQSIQESLFSEMRGVESGTSYGFTPRIDAMPEGSDWMGEIERSSSHMEGLEAQHGEMVFPFHMSTNQFGEAPRTQREVSHSLGVHRGHAERAGFTSH